MGSGRFAPATSPGKVVKVNEIGEQPAVIRLHLWLERGGDTLFGLGRVHLLERIDSCGSLKAERSWE